jgi:hypothetical protein
MHPGPPPASFLKFAITPSPKIDPMYIHEPVCTKDLHITERVSLTFLKIGQQLTKCHIFGAKKIAVNISHTIKKHLSKYFPQQSPEPCVLFMKYTFVTDDYKVKSKNNSAWLFSPYPRVI